MIVLDSLHVGVRCIISYKSIGDTVRLKVPLHSDLAGYRVFLGLLIMSHEFHRVFPALLKLVLARIPPLYFSSVVGIWLPDMDSLGCLAVHPIV